MTVTALYQLATHRTTPASGTTITYVSLLSPPQNRARTPDIQPVTDNDDLPRDNTFAKPHKVDESTQPANPGPSLPHLTGMTPNTNAAVGTMGQDNALVPNVLVAGMSANTYNQFMAGRALSYMRTSGKAAHDLVEATIGHGSRHNFHGTSGEVIIDFSPNGGIATVSVNAESEQLREILADRIVWQSLPSPAENQLPYSRLAIRLSISPSRIQLSVTPS